MVSLWGHAGDRVGSIGGIPKVGVSLKTMFSRTGHSNKYSRRVQLLRDGLQCEAVKKVPRGGEWSMHEKLLGSFNGL